jgi:microcystin-dependent protein
MSSAKENPVLRKEDLAGLVKEVAVLRSLVTGKEHDVKRIEQLSDEVRTLKLVVSALQEAQAADAFLIGTIIWTAAPRAGENNRYLLCDGRRVKRSDFPKLFQVLGGDEKDDTFRLPDLMGRIAMGVDVTGARLSEFKHIGTVAGAASVKLRLGNMPAHAHGKGSLTTVANGVHTHGAVVTDPGHTHTITNDGTSAKPLGGHLGVVPNAGSHCVAGSHSHSHTIEKAVSGISVANTTAGAHTHDLTGEVAAAGAADPDPIPILPPVVALLPLIRAA